LDNVTNLQQYRVSKAIIKDLKGARFALDLAIRALHHYKKFKLILEVVVVMKENMTVLDSLIKKHERILKNEKNPKS
jgi:hypothetical protein